MGLTDRLADAAASALGSVLGYASTIADGALSKASSSRGTVIPAPSAAPAPSGLYYDPYAVLDQLGFRERPTGMTYGSLQELVRRMPVLAAIRQTRINQVARYCSPAIDDRQPGFAIKLYDREASPTRAQKRTMARIEEFLLNTGVTEDEQKADFESFIRQLLWDSLTYDQATAEITHTRKGDLCDFYAIDAATIRIADVPLNIDPKADPDRVRYVQVYDEVIIGEFAAREMMFGVRNPRSSIKLNGYGTTEIEMMVSTVTSLLYAMTWNNKVFTQGTAARGIINIKGAIPQAQLTAFRQQWYQMISGVANAWRTPVVNAEDIQYLNMMTSNRDQEFAEWMNWLTKVACAIYAIDPAEINFLFGNSGQSSALQQQGPAEHITESKDRGLRPLLVSVAAWINRWIVRRIDPQYRFVWTGMDNESIDAETDRQQKLVRYKLTVNEIRAQDDLEPLPDGKGDILLDPTYLQWIQIKGQLEQQGQQGQGGAAAGGPEQGQDQGGGEAGAGEGEGGEAQWQPEPSQDAEPDQTEPQAEKSLRKARVRQQTWPRGGAVFTVDLDV